MAFVEIQSVSKSFFEHDEVIALEDIDLSVRHGELVAILGPSGCGKSTLLRCVAGLERPDKGTITIDESTVSSADHWVPPEQRGLGMVFQSYALWPHMTVYENLAFPMKMRQKRKQDIRSSVLSSLETVGLSGMENRLPSQLSGGQQQRVALARAIIVNPKVLLFDEPLSNLDVNLREAMRIELRELKQTLAWTALYVTHDRAEAVYLADRIVVLRDGRIQQIGMGDELYDRPANRFVAEFMGDINLIPAAKHFLVRSYEELSPRCRQHGGDDVVGFRPEWLRLEKARENGPPTGSWRGQVRLATNLGWYMEYVIEVDGVEMKVRGTTDTQILANQHVDVFPDLKRSIRFPA